MRNRQLHSKAELVSLRLRGSTGQSMTAMTASLNSRGQKVKSAVKSLVIYHLDYTLDFLTPLQQRIYNNDSMGRLSDSSCSEGSGRKFQSERNHQTTHQVSLLVNRGAANQITGSEGQKRASLERRGVPLLLLLFLGPQHQHQLTKQSLTRKGTRRA